VAVIVNCVLVTGAVAAIANVRSVVELPAAMVLPPVTVTPPGKPETDRLTGLPAPLKRWTVTGTLIDWP